MYRLGNQLLLGLKITLIYNKFKKRINSKIQFKNEINVTTLKIVHIKKHVPNKKFIQLNNKQIKMIFKFSFIKFIIINKNTKLIKCTRMKTKLLHKFNNNQIMKYKNKKRIK